MAQVKILLIRGIPSTDRVRLGQTDTMVVYQVDTEAAQSVLVNKANPTEQEILAAIKAQEEAQKAVRGKTFTI